MNYDYHRNYLPGSDKTTARTFSCPFYHKRGNFMGKLFKHLSQNDRIKMETMLNSGHKVVEVAEYLHVHRSTIYREIKRGEYTPRKQGIAAIWGKRTMIGTPREKGGI